MANTIFHFSQGESRLHYVHLSLRETPNLTPPPENRNPEEELTLLRKMISQENKTHSLSISYFRDMLHETYATWGHSERLTQLNARVQESTAKAQMLGQMLDHLAQNPRYQAQTDQLRRELDRLKGFQDLISTLRQGTSFLGVNNWERYFFLVNKGASLTAGLVRFVAPALGLQGNLALTLVAGISHALFQSSAQLIHASHEGQALSLRQAAAEMGEAALAATVCGTLRYGLEKIAGKNCAWTFGIFALDVGAEYSVGSASFVRRALHTEVQGFGDWRYGLASNALGEFLFDGREHVNQMAHNAFVSHAPLVNEHIQIQRASLLSHFSYERTFAVAGFALSFASVHTGLFFLGHHGINLWAGSALSGAIGGMLCITLSQYIQNDPEQFDGVSENLIVARVERKTATLHATPQVQMSVTPELVVPPPSAQPIAKRNGGMLLTFAQIEQLRFLLSFIPDIKQRREVKHLVLQKAKIALNQNQSYNLEEALYKVLDQIRNRDFRRIMLDQEVLQILQTQIPITPDLERTLIQNIRNGEVSSPAQALQFLNEEIDPEWKISTGSYLQVDNNTSSGPRSIGPTTQEVELPHHLLDPKYPSRIPLSATDGTVQRPTIITPSTTSSQNRTKRRSSGTQRVRQIKIDSGSGERTFWPGGYRQHRGVKRSA